MPKVFVDTNVLIYMYDASNKEKQKISRKKVSELEENAIGVISTQIMQEFYVAAVKKLSLDPIITKQIISKFDNFEIVTIDPLLISEAVDCSIINRIPFWDALTVIAAHSAECERIWTEDLNDGQIIKNVKIENIFRTHH